MLRTSWFVIGLLAVFSGPAAAGPAIPPDSALYGEIAAVLGPLGRDLPPEGTRWAWVEASEASIDELGVPFSRVWYLEPVRTRPGGRDGIKLRKTRVTGVVHAMLPAGQPVRLPLTWDDRARAYPAPAGSGGADPVALPRSWVVPDLDQQLARPDHTPGDGLRRLYARWARGGAGLLLTGNVMVDRRYLESHRNVVLEPDSVTDPDFSAWAAARGANGPPVWVQLNHPGRQTPRHIAAEPPAPSAVEPTQRTIWH